MLSVILLVLSLNGLAQDAERPDAETSPSVAPENPEPVREPAAERPLAATTGGEKDPLADKSALEIVLIASDGLNESFDKSTKLDAIRAAVKNALQFIPKETHVGFRISGHRVGRAEGERSCQDSELAVAPEAEQQKAILEKMETVTAQGKRSVAQSLSRALADLAKYGKTKTILLITDGTEECIDQDPVDYLAPASLQNQNFIIHIRGIALDPQSKASLEALAKATNGTFESAVDQFTLSQHMTIGAQRGATPPVTAATELPAERPESGLPQPPTLERPESREMDRVPLIRPEPIPFDPNKLVQKIVAEIRKTLPAQAPPPPSPPTPVPLPPPPPFSKLSLIVISVETLLLILAMTAVVLLILRQKR